VAAILVGGLKCRTQFWKGTTKGSFQQSLVEIGSVVSEEKFFFNFIPLFSIFSLVAILVGSRDHRTQDPMGNSRKNLRLKPVAQLELNFDKIVIGWSSSKNVSGGPAL
jgi:hypothetical protein